jgi:REP element-mobilizing transposase RayT
MVMNEIGKIVELEWLKSAEIRNEIEIDNYVIMPNHMHESPEITGL